MSPKTAIKPILPSQLEGTPRRPLTYKDRTRCAWPCRGDLIPAKHLGWNRWECSAHHHLWDETRRGWVLVSRDPE